MLELGETRLEPEILAAAASNPPTITMSATGLARMAKSRELIDKAAADGTPVYGVTTGLGARVGEKLGRPELSQFSLDTIRGRAHAVGPEESDTNVRAAMIVRLHSLLSGHSGSSPAIAGHLCACLNAGLTPVTPSIGSIGASDLTWNATMALALIGEGRMRDRDGCTGSSDDMMTAKGIAVPVLGPRDGLALVSNSCAVAAASALAFTAAETSYQAAQTAAALSLEAFRANLTPLDPTVLAVKPQPGQDSAAHDLRILLKGSALYDPSQARRLQDPISFRNIPQIHGTVAAALDFARGAINAEINGASDNPVVLVEDGRIVSSGAYFTSELTNAVETISRAFVHLSMAQLARMTKHLDPDFSGLPLFLAEQNSNANGFAPLMKTAEALTGELLHAAQPAAIWPSLNANGAEDCLSSSPIAVRALARVAELSSYLTAIELMIAARAVELRENEKSIAPSLTISLKKLRLLSSGNIDNRPLGSDVNSLAQAIRAKQITG